MFQAKWWPPVRSRTRWWQAGLSTSPTWRHSEGNTGRVALLLDPQWCSTDRERHRRTVCVFVGINGQIGQSYLLIMSTSNGTTEELMSSSSAAIMSRTFEQTPVQGRQCQRENRQQNGGCSSPEGGQVMVGGCSLFSPPPRARIQRRVSGSYYTQLFAVFTQLYGVYNNTQRDCVNWWHCLVPWNRTSWS